MGITFNPFTGTLDFTGGAGGGGGTPAAPDTSVQFNDGGSFGGDSGLTWNKTDGRIAVGTTYDPADLPQTNGLVIGTDEGSGQGAQLVLGSSDADTGLPNLVFLSSNGSVATPTDSTAGNALADMSSWGYVNGQFSEATLISSIVSAVGASVVYGKLALKVRDTSGFDSYLTLDATTLALRFGRDAILENGLALKTDTTTAHTALLQAYDVDGTAYATFATLLNGNVPRFTISQPVGGLLAMIAPTTDPGVSGALWNDNGAPAFSA